MPGRRRRGPVRRTEGFVLSSWRNSHEGVGLRAGNPRVLRYGAVRTSGGEPGVPQRCSQRAPTEGPSWLSGVASLFHSQLFRPGSVAKPLCRSQMDLPAQLRSLFLGANHGHSSAFYVFFLSVPDVLQNLQMRRVWQGVQERCSWLGFCHCKYAVTLREERDYSPTKATGWCRDAS